MSNNIENADLVFQQGADSEVFIKYLDTNGAPIDVSDFEFRMDVRTIDGTRSVSITDASLNNEGGIHIVVPRELTLGGGTFANNIDEVLEYDVFLRSPAGLQKKILRGTMYFENSETLWT